MTLVLGVLQFYCIVATTHVLFCVVVSWLDGTIEVKKVTREGMVANLRNSKLEERSSTGWTIKGLNSFVFARPWTFVVAHLASLLVLYALGGW